MRQLTSQAGHERRQLRAAVLLAAVATAAAIALSPLPQAVSLATKAPSPPHKDKDKDCFITDKAGRKWPCSRMGDWSANFTMYICPIVNRLPADMYVDCDRRIFARYWVEAGGTLYEDYASVFDPAPHPAYSGDDGWRDGPRVSCEWGCDGNTMGGVVVWDETWPEAWSCRKDGGDGDCRLVFESNREVALVTRKGRRVLGDVAIKECSKNLGGWGGWLPFGLGCTYPKHRHPYYGTILSHTRIF